MAALNFKVNTTDHVELVMEVKNVIFTCGYSIAILYLVFFLCTLHYFLNLQLLAGHFETLIFIIVTITQG